MARISLNLFIKMSLWLCLLSRSKSTILHSAWLQEFSLQAIEYKGKNISHLISPPLSLIWPSYDLLFLSHFSLIWSLSHFISHFSLFHLTSHFVLSFDLSFFTPISLSVFFIIVSLSIYLTFLSLLLDLLFLSFPHELLLQLTCTNKTPKTYCCSVFLV